MARQFPSWLVVLIIVAVILVVWFLVAKTDLLRVFESRNLENVRQEVLQSLTAPPAKREISSQERRRLLETLDAADPAGRQPLTEAERRELLQSLR